MNSVWANCRQYNDDHPALLGLASDLEAAFAQRWSSSGETLCTSRSAHLLCLCLESRMHDVTSALSIAGMILPPVLSENTCAASTAKHQEQVLSLMQR